MINLIRCGTSSLGIGGGCFSLLYSASQNKTLALDARGVAPAAAGPDLFMKDGEVQDEWKDLGGQSVAIPACCAQWILC
nr:gamma-glutamyltransferase [Mediterraneibacter butyricigenes]